MIGYKAAVPLIGKTKWHTFKNVFKKKVYLCKEYLEVMIFPREYIDRKQGCCCH